MQINYLSYFLASILSYLGLLVGVILIKLAPEEQKPGKRYFVIIKKILFLLIIAFLLLFYNLNLMLAVMLLAFVIALVFSKKIDLKRTAMVYFFLGIVFYLSSKFISLFAIESILIFLYSIPHASLMLGIRKRNYAHIFAKGLWFFVPIIVLYFVF